jgi:hypothetical protein
VKKRILIMLLTLVLAIAMVLSMALPAAAEIARPTLFSDDFEDGNADGWTEVGSGGTWVVEDDAGFGSKVYSQDDLSSTTTSTYDTYWRSYGGSGWTNYAVEAKVKIMAGGYAPIAGIFFRVQGTELNSGYYYFRLDARPNMGPGLIKSPNSILAGAASGYPQWVNEPAVIGQTYTLKVVAEGNRIKCYVDGVKKIDYVDTTAPYLTGRVGVGTFTAHTHFDDIFVWENPYGIITSPTDSQVFHRGDAISFDAVYWDDDFDAIQWAVRPSNPDLGQPSVWANVDGRTDPSTWDGHLFHSLAPGSETQNWPLGNYYAFVWNPSNDAGEPDVRLVRYFSIVNVPPVADPNGPYLVAVGASVSFNGSASSDADGDSLTYAWTALGGTLNIATAENPLYIAGATAGIYDVGLTVNDGYIDSAQVMTTVVVYDSSAGFVTGGGWIMSPAGAYAADVTLAGKANFGFVSKYKKGANVPEGNTEFQFKAGDLNFKSTSYDWLVVVGTNAKFKGTGTINGAGEYTFMLSADDGSPDTFRIQIWGAGEGLVYDNGSQQAIGGGSIVMTFPPKIMPLALRVLR